MSEHGKSNLSTAEATSAKPSTRPGLKSEVGDPPASMMGIDPLEDNIMWVRNEVPQNATPGPTSTTGDGTQKSLSSLWAKFTRKAEPCPSPSVKTASNQNTKAPNEAATAPAGKHLDTQAEGSS